MPRSPQRLPLELGSVMHDGSFKYDLSTLLRTGEANFTGNAIVDGNQLLGPVQGLFQVLYFIGEIAVQFDQAASAYLPGPPFYNATAPTLHPTSHPSGQPSGQPSARPSRNPSSHPSVQPSGQPFNQPSHQPIGCPTTHPSSHPSSHPSVQPSGQPSARPSRHPTSRPSGQPSMHPTGNC